MCCIRFYLHIFLFGWRHDVNTIIIQSVHNHYTFELGKKKINCLFFGTQWKTIEFRKRLKRGKRKKYTHTSVYIYKKKYTVHRDMVEQLPLDALNERKIDVFKCLIWEMKISSFVCVSLTHSSTMPWMLTTKRFNMLLFERMKKKPYIYTHKKIYGKCTTAAATTEEEKKKYDIFWIEIANYKILSAVKSIPNVLQPIRH